MIMAMDKEEVFFNEPSIMHHLDFLLRDMFSTVPISDGIFGTIQWLPRIFSVSPQRWDTLIKQHVIFATTATFGNSKGMLSKAMKAVKVKVHEVPRRTRVVQEIKDDP